MVDERMAGPDLRRRNDDRRQAQALAEDGRIVAASGPRAGAAVTAPRGPRTRWSPGRSRSCAFPDAGAGVAGHGPKSGIPSPMSTGTRVIVTRWMSPARRNCWTVCPPSTYTCREPLAASRATISLGSPSIRSTYRLRVARSVERTRAEHDDALAGVRPGVELHDDVVGVATDDERVDARHEGRIAVLLAPAGRQEVEVSVGPGEEPVQARPDEDRRADRVQSRRKSLSRPRGAAPERTRGGAPRREPLGAGGDGG